MEEKKIFVFDYDGVLLDSTPAGFRGLIKTAEECNLPPPDAEILRKHWGKNLETDFLDGLAEDLGWQHWDKKLYLESHLAKNNQYQAFKGLSDFLVEMKRQGKHLAILTNRDLNSLIATAYQAGIDLKFFQMIITPNNGLVKPNPKMFNQLWEDNFRPEETVFVGDSILYDLAVANNHRPAIDFIAIASGLHEEKEFVEAGVPEKLILDSPVKILELI